MSKGRALGVLLVSLVWIGTMGIAGARAEAAPVRPPVLSVKLIGVVDPVGVTGVIENEKVTNDAVAFIRSIADRWNRNADWAEKAVRDAISAPAEQALQLHVVDIVVPSTGELLSLVGGCGARTESVYTTGLLRGKTDLGAPAIC